MNNTYLLRIGLLITTFLTLVNFNADAQFVPDIGRNGVTKNYLDVSAPNPRTIYVVGDTSGVYKTSNGGQDWSTLSVSGLGSMDTLGVVHFLNPDTGFVAKVNLAQGVSELFRTFDGINFGSIISSMSDSIIMTVKDVHDTVYVAGQNGLFQVSTDGGLSFTSKSSSFPTAALITDIHFLSGNHGFAIDTGGILYETNNAGDSWNTVAGFTSQSGGFVRYQISFADASIGFISGKGFIYKSTDGGANWSSGTNVTTNTITGIEFHNPLFGIGVGGKSGAGEIMFTVDGGANFEVLPLGFETFSALDLVNPNVTYFVGSNGKMHKFARGSVGGNVKNENSNPIDGRVLLFRVGQGKFDTTSVETLSSGAFQFNDILAGKYLILAVPDSANLYFATYQAGMVGWKDNPQMQIDTAISGLEITLRSKPIPPGKGPGFIKGLLKEAGSAKRGPGDPLDGADVSLQKRSDDSIIMNTVTNDSGTFIFDNVPIGNYRLLVDVPGVELDTSALNNIAISDSDSTYDQVEIEVDSTTISVQVNQEDTADTSSGIVHLSKTLVEIWPNPAKHNFWVNVDKDIAVEEGTFELYDVRGAIVRTMNYRRAGNNNRIEFDVSGLNNGVYMLRMQIYDTNGTSHSAGTKIIVTK